MIVVVGCTRSVRIINCHSNAATAAFQRTENREHTKYLADFAFSGFGVCEGVAAPWLTS